MSDCSQLKRVSRERLRQREWDPMPWDGIRRTVHTETKDTTFATLERAGQMRRKLHDRKHEEYKIFYYGNEEEKAIYHEKIRDCLHEQMERRERERQHFSSNTEESDQLTKSSMEFMQQEREHNERKRQQFITIRDSNKMQIELKAEQRKIEQMADQSLEQETLQQNPINWSHTLS